MVVFTPVSLVMIMLKSAVNYKPFILFIYTNLMKTSGYEGEYFENKSTYVLMPRWEWMTAAHIAGTTTYAVQ